MSRRFSIDLANPVAESITILSQLEDESYREVFYAYFSQAAWIASTHDVAEADTFLCKYHGFLANVDGPHISQEYAGCGLLG